jgi:hypothetical protein
MERDSRSRGRRWLSDDRYYLSSICNNPLFFLLCLLFALSIFLLPFRFLFVFFFFFIFFSSPFRLLFDFLSFPFHLLFISFSISYIPGTPISPILNCSSCLYASSPCAISKGPVASVPALAQMGAGPNQILVFLFYFVRDVRPPSPIFQVT